MRPLVAALTPDDNRPDLTPTLRPAVKTRRIELVRR